MNKWLRFFVGILISVILLFVVFRKVDLKLILHNIFQLKIRYLSASIALGILLLLLRSYRWKQFIKEYKQHKITDFFESISIGLFFNNVLPFRIGDLIQAYTISKKTGLSKSLSFSTVLMERFIDLFPPILFIIIGSFFIILPSQISVPLSVFVLCLLCVFFALLLKLKNVILQQLNSFGNRYVIALRLAKLMENFYLAVGNFRNIKILTKTALLTLLLWCGYSMSMVLVCYSLGIKLPSLWAGFLIQAITALSVTIPSSPGYIGSWEFMATLALTIFNVDKVKALSFALISRVAGMLPVFVLGSIFVIKEISLIKVVYKSDIYETKQKATD